MQCKPGSLRLAPLFLSFCAAAAFATEPFDIPFDKLPGGRMNAKGELDPTSSPEGRARRRLCRREEAGAVPQLRVGALDSHRAVEAGSGHGQVERRRPGRISDRLGFDGARHRGRLPVLGPQQLHEHHRPGRHARRDHLPDPAGPGEESARRSRPHEAARPRMAARPPCAIASCVRTTTRPPMAATDADGAQRRDRHGRRRHHLHARSEDLPAHRPGRDGEGRARARVLPLA